MIPDSILEVKNLKVHFNTDEGELRAVNGVSFNVPRGKVLGIVGESGCGKSVTSYATMRLVQKPGRIVGGSIMLHPRDEDSFDVLTLHEKSKRLLDVRGKLASMVFQEPMTALSPVHTIGNQICEAILMHRDVSKGQAEKRAIEMLAKVGIPGPERRIHQYPFELSGGMRQRAVIAMALVCDPQLLIADEPTTALDVTIQAQIMRLIKDLQREMGVSTIWITHDLGVVGQLCDEVVVMYLGRIVETGPVREIIHRPRHPYTIGLLASLPSLAMDNSELPYIRGSVPNLTEIPTGCPFHPRCGYCEPGVCDVGEPPEPEALEDGHFVACFRVDEFPDDAIERARRSVR